MSDKIEPIGPERAEEIVTHFDKVSYSADEALKSYERKAITTDEFEETHQVYEDARNELVSLLSGQVDWRERALRKEDREERDACVLGQYEALTRRLCGPAARGPEDLDHLVDGLQGSVEAVALQRDEQAAFALTLLDHLRSLPTSEMNEGIENIHHAVCASPRTRESEERSIALLEAQVSARVTAKLERHIRNAEELERLVRAQELEHAIQIRVMQSDVQESRLLGFRALIIGSLSGATTVSLVYGVVRLLS